MRILKEKRIIKAPKIIACLSQKGGGGKSTFARCLATELTKQKLNTLLVLRHPTKKPAKNERKDVKAEK